MVFPVVMYGCESWTIKMTEHWGTFKLWWQRWLSWAPCTAKWLNQVILKEISNDYSLEGLMLKLRLQYFDHLMWRTNSLGRPWCWERLRAREEYGDRGWDDWMASWTQWTWVWATSGRWWRIEKPGVLQSMGLQTVRHDWANKQQFTKEAPIGGGEVRQGSRPLDGFVKKLFILYWSIAK